MEALHPVRMSAARKYEAAIAAKRALHCGCDKAATDAAFAALSQARRALADAEAAYPTAAEAERIRRVAVDRKADQAVAA